VSRSVTWPALVFNPCRAIGAASAHSQWQAALVVKPCKEPDVFELESEGLVLTVDYCADWALTDVVNLVALRQNDAFVGLLTGLIPL